MLSRNRLILPAVLSSLAIMAACGSGSGSSKPPVNSPSSGFSNTNLSGSYVFSTTGYDSSSNFLTIMGVFSADGKGNVTGGAIDENRTLPSGGTKGNDVRQANITAGTYNVASDGRPTGTSNSPDGLITLQTDTAGTFQFNYVLTSGRHGLIIEFETFGSGSGTLDLQSAVTQADLNGQSYAFNLTGTSGFDNVFCGRLRPGFSALVSYATIGAFALDSSGNIASGLEDFNNNCVSSDPTGVPVTGGGIALGQYGFGTAAITTGMDPTAITYNFDVFPIDATHLKFVQTDSYTAGPISVLVGEAFTQQSTSSIPAGNNVFTMAGFDNSIFEPFTAAGIFHTDASGTILPDSVEDMHEVDAQHSNSISLEANFSGSSTPLSGGRAQLTLNGFINGNQNGTLCSGCVFAVYPSTGGLQMLEIDNLGSTDGIAYPQTATTLPSGQGFGMNLSGVAFGVSSENTQDDIAQFTNSNGNFTGTIDSNGQGTLSFSNSLSAQYSADTSVPGRGTVAAVTNTVDLTTYVVDSSTAVAVSTDPTFVGLGTLVQQNSSASSSVLANHLAVMHVQSSARPNSTRKESPTRPK